MRYFATTIDDAGDTTVDGYDTQGEVITRYQAVQQQTAPAVLLFWVWDSLTTTWLFQENY